jgi:hypothetical protein
MVTKNQKTINNVRKKQGKATIQETAKLKEKDDIIKGRSWMFPSILVFVAVFYFFAYPYGEISRDKWYWITGLSYIALGILMYLVRRPVIRITRTSISLRRFNGDKIVAPHDTEEITLNKGHIVIRLKQKNKKYVYTKLQHRFPMDILNARLREYAIQHKITLKDETV